MAWFLPSLNLECLYTALCGVAGQVPAQPHVRGDCCTVQGHRTARPARCRAPRRHQQGTNTSALLISNKGRYGHVPKPPADLTGEGMPAAFICNGPKCCLARSGAGGCASNSRALARRRRRRRSRSGRSRRRRRGTTGRRSRSSATTRSWASSRSSASRSFPSFKSVLNLFKKNRFKTESIKVRWASSRSSASRSLSSFQVGAPAGRFLVSNSV